MRTDRDSAELVGGGKQRALLAVAAVLTGGQAMLAWEQRGDHEIEVKEGTWQDVEGPGVSFKVTLAEKAICGIPPSLVFDPPEAAGFVRC